MARSLLPPTCMTGQTIRRASSAPNRQASSAGMSLSKKVTASRCICSAASGSASSTVVRQLGPITRGKNTSSASGGPRCRRAMEELVGRGAEIRCARSIHRRSLDQDQASGARRPRGSQLHGDRAGIGAADNMGLIDPKAMSAPRSPPRPSRPNRKDPRYCCPRIRDGGTRSCDRRRVRARPRGVAVRRPSKPAARRPWALPSPTEQPRAGRRPPISGSSSSIFQSFGGTIGHNQSSTPARRASPAT